MIIAQSFLTLVDLFLPLGADCYDRYLKDTRNYGAVKPKVSDSIKKALKKRFSPYWIEGNSSSERVFTYIKIYHFLEFFISIASLIAGIVVASGAITSPLIVSSLLIACASAMLVTTGMAKILVVEMQYKEFILYKMGGKSITWSNFKENLTSPTKEKLKEFACLEIEGLARINFSDDAIVFSQVENFARECQEANNRFRDGLPKKISSQSGDMEIDLESMDARGELDLKPLERDIKAINRNGNFRHPAKVMDVVSREQSQPIYYNEGRE